MRHLAHKTWAQGRLARKILAQRGPSSRISAKKLAQQAQKCRILAVLSAQGELFRAHTHIRPRRANFFAHEARQHGDIETDNTTARLQQGSLETGITSAPENCTKNAHFSPAKAMTVSIPRERERAKVTAVSDKARPAPAKAMAVSDNRPSWPTGSGCGTRGRRQGLAGLRAEAQAHISTPGPTGVEGTGGICRGAGGRWRGLAGLRAEAQARISTPGPTGVEGAGGICRGAGGRWRGLAGLRDDAPSEARSAGGSRAGRRPPAHTAAGASGARNTRGHTKPPGPTGAGRLSQFRKLSAESRQCRGLRGRSPGGRWKYRAWKQRPSRFPPCGGPRRRRWRSAWPSRRRSRRRCLRSRPG